MMPQITSMSTSTTSLGFSRGLIEEEQGWFPKVTILVVNIFVRAIISSALEFWLRQQREFDNNLNWHYRESVFIENLYVERANCYLESGRVEEGPQGGFGEG